MVSRTTAPLSRTTSRTLEPDGPAGSTLVEPNQSPVSEMMNLMQRVFKLEPEDPA
jgi:hypothetical protein